MTVLIVLIAVPFLVAYVVGCDYSVTDFKIIDCPGAKNAFKGSCDMPIFSDDCSSVSTQCQTTWTKGVVTSAKLSVHGTASGIPIVFSDNGACENTDKQSLESPFSDVIASITKTCTAMKDSNFGVTVPLNDLVQSALFTMRGQHRYDVKVLSMNGDDSIKLCFSINGKLQSASMLPLPGKLGKRRGFGF